MHNDILYRYWNNIDNQEDNCFFLILEYSNEYQVKVKF